MTGVQTCALPISVSVSLIVILAIQEPLLALLVLYSHLMQFLVKQPSMLKMLEDPNSKPNFQGRLKIIKDFCYTISTKQMRIPNAGILPIGAGKYRYLTMRD